MTDDDWKIHEEACKICQKEILPYSKSESFDLSYLDFAQVFRLSADDIRHISQRIPDKAASSPYAIVRGAL
jgi:hypothetical protein